jgi:hypothetical protein
MPKISTHTGLKCAIKGVVESVVDSRFPFSNGRHEMAGKMKKPAAKKAAAKKPAAKKTAAKKPAKKAAAKKPAAKKTAKKKAAKK